MKLREWRHNPCLMRPVTALLLLAVAVFWVTVTVLKFPTLVLGLLLSPLLTRFYWVIEFWYPTGIGKWLHLTVIRLAHRSSRGSNDGTSGSFDVNRGFHSRSTETRVEIVPGRVFVHPLPQLLDNLGYLVVCLPPPSPVSTDATTAAAATNQETTSLGESLYVDPHANEDRATRIVAFCVDCGDSDAVAKHVQLIRQTFYNDKPIHVQSVLSTHKHHDHTAGNYSILKHADFQNPTKVKLIFGGAVDKVPGCNYPLANGDKLPLPKAGKNNMNDVIEVEAVATPAHTRGSLTYVLRPLPGIPHDAAACLFTGDTVFSAGGGVPFEADIDPGQEANAPKMTANSYIKASAAANAIERCFAEVLYRSVPIGLDSSFITTTSDRLLVFPGHEYTNELLTRQLSQPPQSESCKWKNLAPASYFQTVSQLYVTLHRRTLPHSSGKLMTVPSPISRELYINPHLRSLKQRGTVVLAAIKLWNRNFSKARVSDSFEGGPAFVLAAATATDGSSMVTTTSQTTRAKESQWNLNTTDLNRQVFATVYAADLDSIIEDLGAGKIDPATAAARLKELKMALEHPVTGRRPIPGTLPSSRTVYRGLLGLALLGSAPTALTHSDSIAMKLPAPIVASSDRIRVNKRRLIAVLHWLGLLDDDDGKSLVAIISQLWKETKEYSAMLDAASFLRNKESELSFMQKKRNESDLELQQEEIKNNSTDSESVPEADDEVELGALKWIIYGIPTQQPKSWFSTYCMPCCKPAVAEDLPSKEHPAGKSGMNRHGGELVRHDVLTCPLCRDATGCPELSQQVEEVNGYTHQISSMRIATDCEPADEDSGAFVEVSPQSFSSISRI